MSWPQPEAEFIAASFRLFAEKHPWVGEADLHPKGVAREMFEGCLGFVDCVRELGVGRSEGLLLRYVSQVHDTLVRSVPDDCKTQAVYDAIAYFRTLVQGVDASLLQAWEALRAPSLAAAAATPPPPFDLALHERALVARVRAELHGLVRALALQDWEAAAASVRADPDDVWDADRIAQALAPFLAEYGAAGFHARRAPRPPHAHRRGGAAALARGPGARRSRRRRAVGRCMETSTSRASGTPPARSCSSGASGPERSAGAQTRYTSGLAEDPMRQLLPCAAPP